MKEGGVVVGGGIGHRRDHPQAGRSCQSC